MSILNLFIAAGRAVADWHRRQRAYAELMALDDRCLADIGIHRTQIGALVAGDRPSGSSDGATGAPNFWAVQACAIGCSNWPGL